MNDVRTADCEKLNNWIAHEPHGWWENDGWKQCPGLTEKEVDKLFSKIGLRRTGSEKADTLNLHYLLQSPGRTSLKYLDTSGKVQLSLINDDVFLEPKRVEYTEKDVIMAEFYHKLLSGGLSVPAQEAYDEFALETFGMDRDELIMELFKQKREVEKLEDKISRLAGVLARAYSDLFGEEIK